MSDIIKTDKIITLSSARETKIRNAINKWAQNILYHDHRTLGSKLKIIEAYESPFYLMRLWSETDNRFVTETYTSNIPQQIGERKYSSINEVNVWAFNYDIPDAFSKSTETDRIKNSEHLKNCLKCGALGTVTCSCKTGTVTCPNCKGGQITKSRDVSCSVCKGKGKINRTIKVTEPTPGWSPTSSGPKNQTVTKTVSENCKTCRGSGKVKENYSERCPKCNGTAKIVCPTCRGKKVIKCTTCNGNGQLLYNYNITRNLSYNYYSDVYNGKMTSEEIDLFLKSIKDSSEKIIFTDYNNDAKINNPEIAKIPIIGSALNNLLKNAHRQETSNTKILFEKITVAEHPVIVLIYSYQGKKYRMLIKEGISIEILALSSPISDTFEELRNEAISATRKRRFGAAYKKLQKVIHFPQATRAEKDLLRGVERRMENAVEFGIQMSAYISTVLMLILGSFYYTEINYVLPWADFANKATGFWNMASIGNVLITIILFFIASRKYRNRIPISFYSIPSAIARISVGFVTGIILMSLIAFLWAAINFTGVGVFFAAAAWGVIYAVIIAIFLVYMLIKWIVGLF